MFIAALLTLTRTWKQPRCPLADEWVKKLWYIYTMEYYSAIKKEHIWVSSNEVAETGAYYTEWSKPQTETWIQYINAYIWNLERWEWQLYMQDSKRDTEIKKRLLDYMEEGEGGTIWENSTETCILPYVKQMTNRSSMHEAGHSKPVLWSWGLAAACRASRKTVNSERWCFLCPVQENFAFPSVMKRSGRRLKP